MNTDDNFSPQRSRRPQRTPYGNRDLLSKPSLREANCDEAIQNIWIAAPLTAARDDVWGRLERNIPKEPRITQSSAESRKIKVSLRSLRLCGRRFFWRLPHPAQSILLLTLMVWLFSPEIVLAESVSSTIQEGISDYQQQNFEKAESSFSKAAQELPDSPKINYNLGNSQYKTGKFKEALQTYTKAMAEESPPELKGKALFNSGNALFRLGKLEEAETAYKKVLQVNPKDMDAKFNLEFVREQIKKKNEEKQKQNQPPGSDSKDNQNQQKNDSPGNDEDDNGNPSDPKNQDSSSNGELKPDAPPSPAEQQEAPDSQLAEDKGNAISKDQADHWLNALNEDLKKFRQKQARSENAGRPKQSRDW
jgi:Ca-activated chloride channel homolog